MNYESVHLIIRADASSSSGMGHVMRSLALAQHWTAMKGKATFLSWCESDILRNLIQTSGTEFIPLSKPHPDPHDLHSTLKLLKEIEKQHIKTVGDTWLALDGYHFDSNYQQALGDAGCKLLVTDDTAHLPRYHADILVNQNLDAEMLPYKTDSETLKLLGTNYALIRQEFAGRKPAQRQTPDKAFNVLVTLGGSDEANTTLKIVEALALLARRDMNVKIVLGPTNFHRASLERFKSSMPGELQLISTTTTMPELMAWADIAISAAGSTCWELAYMGVPMILIVLAENQVGIANGLAKRGLAVNLGWHTQVTAEEIAQAFENLSQSAHGRDQMSRMGRALIDGQGATRVADRMTQLSMASTV